MADESTPEEIAAFAAGLRREGSATAEQNRALVEALHPEDPESPEAPTPEAQPAVTEDFHAEVARALTAPKPAHVDLVRQLHGGGDE
jgi:hypothetical protein